MTGKLWMVTAVAAMLAGCANRDQSVDSSSGAPRQTESTTELVAQARPPIPDLPIPTGFTLAEGKSRNFAAAGARYVDHVYSGRADKFAVGRFYRRQMPVNGWVMVTDMFVQGDIVLDFEKETERCRIDLTDSSPMGWSTTMKIQLWTSGRIETPKHDLKK